MVQEEGEVRILLMVEEEVAQISHIFQMYLVQIMAREIDLQMEILITPLAHQIQAEIQQSQIGTRDVRSEE